MKLAGVEARDIFVEADRERLIASFFTSLAEFLSATFVGLITELLGKSQCVLFPGSKRATLGDTRT